LSKFWLSEEQFERLRPLLPDKVRGVARVDDRRVISGIIHVGRSGGGWVDASACYGPRKTLYNRFVRWAAIGIWQKMLVTGGSGWTARRRPDRQHTYEGLLITEGILQGRGFGMPSSSRMGANAIAQRAACTCAARSGIGARSAPLEPVPGCRDGQAGRRAVDNQGKVVPQAIGTCTGGRPNQSRVEVGQRVAACTRSTPATSRCRSRRRWRSASSRR